MDKIHIYRKTETNGSVYEDGADTRKTTSRLIVVPENQLDDFNEYVADDCGYQDYGYQVSYDKLTTIYSDEVKPLIEQLKDLK